MTPIAPHIEAFLREHLARQRGASQHTCDSYACSFQSLFEFASRKLKTPPSALTLEQLDATLVSMFLEHLEATRRNSAKTRNVRLAAIRSFFRFLQHREPAALDQIRRVLAIPFKKSDTHLVPYLSQDEAQALLDAPDPTTREGIRDRALLHLAVCAGLRVSELTGLRTDDVAPRSISIRVRGKAAESGRCRSGKQLLQGCALGWLYAEMWLRRSCLSTPGASRSVAGAWHTC
jgi:integrase/recombinase XerD